MIAALTKTMRYSNRLDAFVMWILLMIAFVLTMVCLTPECETDDRCDDGAECVDYVCRCPKSGTPRCVDVPETATASERVATFTEFDRRHPRPNYELRYVVFYVVWTPVLNLLRRLVVRTWSPHEPNKEFRDVYARTALAWLYGVLGVVAASHATRSLLPSNFTSAFDFIVVCVAAVPVLGMFAMTLETGEER